jgi:hypothetical protein
MIKYDSKLSDDEFINKSTELKCADCRVSRDKAAEKKSELRHTQERERVAELRRNCCRQKAEKKTER